MSEPKSFSFFLGGSSPKEISEKEKPTLEYIILQNDFLHKKIKTLEVELLEVNTEKNTFEEDNERLEKSITGLRGIAINECEMGKLLEHIIGGYKICIKEHEVLNYQYYKEMRNKNIFTLIISLIYFFLLIFLGIDTSVLTILYFAGTSLYSPGNLGDIFMRRPIIKMNKIYSEKEKEYKELRKNQDYISKMVENM